MTGPAAVVGAGGFLGQHLTRALRDAGVDVRSYTRSQPCVQDGGLAPGMADSQVIFYLATSVNLGIAQRYPELVTADFDAFAGLITALADLGTRPAVVLASSGTGYATSATPPFTEDSPTASDTAYGRLKLWMEKALLDHTDVVRPIVARLASMYGPGHHTEPGHGVIAHWLTALAMDRPITLIGDMEVRRDFVYVADVAEAFVRMHSVLTSGRQLPSVMNISSGVPVTLSHLFDTIIEVTGRRPEVIRQDARVYDRPELCQDAGLARQAMGWYARTSLSEGLARTWEAILAEVRCQAR